MISEYSPAASVSSPGVSSPGGIYLAAQSPQMPSPTLSISNIVRPQARAFAGQSPVIAHRFLIELHTASLGGDEAVVKLLLDRGADVNAQGGYYGNALQAASSGGYEVVVKMLRARGEK